MSENHREDFFSTHTVYTGGQTDDRRTDKRQYIQRCYSKLHQKLVHS